MMDFKLLFTPERTARLRRAMRLAAPPAPRAPPSEKATTPPAPAQSKPAPRTPTAAEREAEREADRKQREREFARLMEFVKNPAASPFAHLAHFREQVVEPPQVAEQFIPGKGADASQFETHVPDPAAMAREVLRCGELARGIGPQRAAPTGFAAQVLEAGRKRRCFSVVELPTDPVARAVVLAGMRRRGEIE
jgi:hypothetical protein